MATELTREQLEIALIDLRSSSSGTGGRDVVSIYGETAAVLLAAAERLLAQKPASAEERKDIIEASFTSDRWTHVDVAIAAAERRLLLFADADVRDETEATR